MTNNAKPILGAVGTAAAGIIWPLLAVFNGKIGAMPAEALSSLSVNTGVVLGAILYYLVPTDGWHRRKKG